MAYQAAHETCRCEYQVQSGEILLDGVCPLGENQAQKNKSFSMLQNIFLGHADT